MNIVITFRGPIQSHKAGWYKALIHLGHNVIFWSEEHKPTFDLFDEFKPDIVIAPPDHLTKSLLKCIEERKATIKVVSEAGLWVDKAVYDIRPDHAYICASEGQIKNIDKLKSCIDPTRIFMVSKNIEKHTQQTHKGWIDKGLRVVSIPLAFDSLTFTHSNPAPYFSCDISYVGGYHENKALKLNTIFGIYSKYKETHNIKIFGDRQWRLPCYCGYVRDDMLMSLFRSTKANLNILHPYDQYGFEINERIFKILGAGMVPWTEKTEGIEELLGEYLSRETDIEKFIGSSTELKSRSLYHDFLDNHTYINRMQHLLCTLDA